MTRAKTHRLMPDSIFAEAYRIAGTVGEGAMGTVYRAERLTDGSACALKVLKPSIASDHLKATERFAREAGVGDKIGSPHVVDVLEAGFDEATGLHWLTMELLEGLPLGAYLKDHAPDRATRLRLIDELFSAMVAAHKAGVIHRDLKPDNLFVVDLAAKPTLMVLDFGVAKILRSGLAASATEGGLGTPLWTAPEQGRAGEHIRPRVDVWALGLLVFYLLTGKIYWRHSNDERSSMLDLAKEMLRDPIEPPLLRATQLGIEEGVLPAGIDAWFSRCVVREVESRYVDAGEAEAGWRQVLAGIPVAPSMPPPPKPALRTPSEPPIPRGPATLRSSPPGPIAGSKVTLAVVIAALLGVIAAVAAWMFSR